MSILFPCDFLEKCYIFHNHSELYSESFTHIQFRKMSEKFKFEWEIHSAFYTAYLLRIMGKCVFFSLLFPAPRTKCHTDGAHNRVERVCPCPCALCMKTKTLAARKLDWRASNHCESSEKHRQCAEKQNSNSVLQVGACYCLGMH